MPKKPPIVGDSHGCWRWNVPTSAGANPLHPPAETPQSRASAERHAAWVRKAMDQADKEYDAPSRLRSALVKIRSSVPRFVTKDEPSGAASFRPLLSRLYPHGYSTPCPEKLFVSVLRSVASCCNLAVPDIQLLARELDPAGTGSVEHPAVCSFLGCGKDGEVDTAALVEQIYRAPGKGVTPIAGFVDGLKTYKQAPHYRSYDPTRARCSGRNPHRPKNGLRIPGEPGRKKKKKPPRAHPPESELASPLGGFIDPSPSPPSSIAADSRPATRGSGASTFPAPQLYSMDGEAVRRHSVPASFLGPQVQKEPAIRRASLAGLSLVEKARGYRLGGAYLGQEAPPILGYRREPPRPRTAASAASARAAATAEGRVLLEIQDREPSHWSDTRAAPRLERRGGSTCPGSHTMAAPVQPDARDIGPGWDPTQGELEGPQHEAVMVVRPRTAQGAVVGRGGPRLHAIGPETEALYRYERGDTPGQTRPGSRASSRSKVSAGGKRQHRARSSLGGSVVGSLGGSSKAETEFQEWRERVGRQLEREISEEDWVSYLEETPGYTPPPSVYGAYPKWYDNRGGEPPDKAAAEAELRKQRLGLLGSEEPKSNVERLLRAEERRAEDKATKADRGPATLHYSGPSTAECLQKDSFALSKADRLRASQSQVVDNEMLVRLFNEAGVTTDHAMIQTATESFITISKGRDSIPMNQCDLVLERLGVKTAYQRMKIFDAFDGDGDKVMEYREFIWGLSLLIPGSLVQQFQSHWDSMARLTEFSHLSLQGGGTLQPSEVTALIAKNGHVHDEKLLHAMAKETMRCVGFTGSEKKGGFVWESFQDAVISDSSVQTIMKACITGEKEAMLKARVLLSVPLQEQIDAKRGQAHWIDEGAPAATPSAPEPDAPHASN